MLRIAQRTFGEVCRVQFFHALANQQLEVELFLLSMYVQLLYPPYFSPMPAFDRVMKLSWPSIWNVDAGCVYG